MKTTNCFIMVILFAFGIFISSASGESLGKSESGKKIHVLEINERLLHCEDGLIIGNGDLSVSVYQTVDRIIWRFGKNDVWDRRIDLSDDPKPLHIKEFAHGIKVEGWKCNPYGGPVEALHGTDNPERMREVCQGSPPSYKNRPYPCPKPVGELVMQLPSDQANMKITQRLFIEKGCIEIQCSWPSGVKLSVKGFIPPSTNVLVLNWKIENWNEETRTGRASKVPVWFWLFRWADPDVREFSARYEADYRHGGFKELGGQKVTPLSPPSVREIEGSYVIEQSFGKDPLFKDGFSYWAAPFAPGMEVQPVDMKPTKEARIRILPTSELREGWLAVNVSTSSDKGGVRSEFLRVKNILAENPIKIMKRWQEESIKDAKGFWSKSNISIDDPFLENLWYETLHVCRSTISSDTDPPGLYLPSTLADYQHWHGDYHTNYNVQCPFLGSYTSNHIEIGDAYFNAMEYFLQMGKIIARKYYDARGVFIQISGYPIHSEDDCLGIAPMGRMAYMTGWAMNQYWWRYQYTKDKKWLREIGYPAIRDGALFYLDFLQKWDDGLYHAFPSNQGEDGFSGYPDELTDRAEVMQHMRYCLRCAIKASKELGIDEDLRAEWKDRLKNSAPDSKVKGGPRFSSHYGNAAPKLEGYEKRIAELNPPEFGLGRQYRLEPYDLESSSALKDLEANRTWYFGYLPYVLMNMLRESTYDVNRDFDEFRKMLVRWRRPNGMMQGMAIADYGRPGAMTESLGILGPFQEMMLQSWDGALRIFPAWPNHLSTHFRDFRAEGAFLVSAEKKGKDINYVKIKSLAGSPLQIYNPFNDKGNVRIRDLSTGKTIAESRWSELEIVKIDTDKDHVYVMERISKPYESFE